MKLTGQKIKIRVKPLKNNCLENVTNMESIQYGEIAIIPKPDSVIPLDISNMYSESSIQHETCQLIDVSTVKKVIMKLKCQRNYIIHLFKRRKKQ